MTYGKICLLLAAIAVVCPVIVYAADGTGVKTEKGIRFAVPDDWPIEERNGAVAPVSVEEYVIKKFKEIEARLDQIEKNAEDVSSKTKSKDISSVKSSSAQEEPDNIQNQQNEYPFLF
jgi:hypothetical protein